MDSHYTSVWCPLQRTGWLCLCGIDLKHACFISWRYLNLHLLLGIRNNNRSKLLIYKSAFQSLVNILYWEFKWIFYYLETCTDSNDRNTWMMNTCRAKCEYFIRKEQIICSKWKQIQIRIGDALLVSSEVCLNGSQGVWSRLEENSQRFLLPWGQRKAVFIKGAVDIYIYLFIYIFISCLFKDWKSMINTFNHCLSKCLLSLCENPFIKLTSVAFLCLLLLSIIV